MVLTENSLYFRIKVELANFKDKYKSLPYVLILNPAAAHATDIASRIRNDFPFLPALQIQYSNKVELNEFEIF